MGVLSWIVFGLIAGAVAKMLMPGKDPGGWLVTMFLGVAGALVGGWIGKLIGFESNAHWGIGYFITAVSGSILLLMIYRFIQKNRDA